MATIRAIEAQSVHQIQSGQVIVDLSSVVKELVENSLDANSSSVEVRFKNYGLDSIEVQDNGTGISAANYESVALKHHTSKLSSYDDLSSLHTFGFRGEALSSLCALSTFHITTAQAGEAPKGNRLDFESSGKLKSTSVVACQKGTTAAVENLFEQLPVRRKELAKNIKREYGKVIGLLHAYACICTNVKFSVKNSMSKGKSMTVFATNSNATTRENIANVYGAKTLSALVALDLDLDFQPTLTQMGRADSRHGQIGVRGHISKPVFGEGRQTPDRQMFFVNGRPCGLPQIAKAINEVYRSFNVSQSPFVFADFEMDTNAYDVNVSPDKRSILLHDSVALIEKLKSSLTELFEKQDQTIPQSLVRTSRLPTFKQLNINTDSVLDTHTNISSHRGSKLSESHALQDESSDHQSEADNEIDLNRVLHDHFRNHASTREDPKEESAGISAIKLRKEKEQRAGKLLKALADQARAVIEDDRMIDDSGMQSPGQSDRVDREEEPAAVHVRDFNERMAEQQTKTISEKPQPALHLAEDNVDNSASSYQPIYEQTNIVQDAFDRMRPKRANAEVATITIGKKTLTTVVGSQYPKTYGSPAKESLGSKKKKLHLGSVRHTFTQQFSQSLRKFGAPGTRSEDSESVDGSDIEDSENESDHSSADADVNLKSQRRGIVNRMEESVVQRRPISQSDLEEPDSDLDYIDEAEKKAAEEARVAELIRAAEESAAVPTQENLKRVNKVLKSGNSKDSTLRLETTIALDMGDLDEKMYSLRVATEFAGVTRGGLETNDEITAGSEEERLSLTISKDDFPNMHIIGQFNLGFILAVRPGPPVTSESNPSWNSEDELFIIDQHASDEKFNFERLQMETIVGNQRLVRPLTLDLTAVEEEIVLENLPALEKNGFLVDVDTSGDLPVGQRCKLVSLPLSKEVVFDTRDLEELIHLLAEAPTLNSESIVPRPTKVRKMFAMRACRSSIMIGKTLSGRQMSTVLAHMGTIDKPWNCPHGRPTMRHLTSLSAINVWQEGDGMAGLGGARDDAAAIWRTYTE